MHRRRVQRWLPRVDRSTSLAEVLLICVGSFAEVGAVSGLPPRPDEKVRAAIGPCSQLFVAGRIQVLRGGVVCFQSRPV